MLNLASFWKGQTMLPDRSILVGQKLVENAKIEKFKWDILGEVRLVKHTIEEFSVSEIKTSDATSRRRCHLWEEHLCPFLVLEDNLIKAFIGRRKELPIFAGKFHSTILVGCSREIATEKQRIFRSRRKSFCGSRNGKTRTIGRTRSCAGGGRWTNRCETLTIARVVIEKWSSRCGSWPPRCRCSPGGSCSPGSSCSCSGRRPPCCSSGRRCRSPGGGGGRRDFRAQVVGDKIDGSLFA